MFDYRALLRWHLDPERLPRGSVVLNRPFSFYETYKEYVWAGLSGMGLESIAILVLLFTVHKTTRKGRAKVREAEERYRSIVEDGTELIGRIAPDGSWRFVNGVLSRLLEHLPDSDRLSSFWALFAENERDVVRRQLSSLTLAQPSCAVEHALALGIEKCQWLSWTCRGLAGPAGSIAEIQLVGRDITARRSAEEALRQALLRVEQGNAALAAVNTNLQSVLDGMREGLFVCDLQGRLLPIWSRVISAWFGAPQTGAFVWDYLAPDQLRLAHSLRLGIEQIVEDVLPFELSSAQLPKNLRRGSRAFRVDCQQLTRNDITRELLFVVTDVTAQLAQERTERINRELPIVVGHLLRDRAGFQGFVVDTAGQIKSLHSIEDKSELRRTLHTLKGNTASYGLLHFSSLCHTLEDQMAECAEEPTLESIEKLSSSWEESLSTVGVFLSAEADDLVQIERAEYGELLSRIEKNEEHSRLLQLARTWAHPPLSQILQIHAESARYLARRVGKEVSVKVVDNGVRLPASSLRPFLGSLVHVVRNAIDHGIEEPSDRVAKGKRRAGAIVLSTSIVADNFIIAIHDDGRGIDWELVRKKARHLNLPHMTPQELVAALGVDGFTTKEAVSEISGRGVGMSAVYRGCEELSGTVLVVSSAAEGTTFEFCIPLGAIQYSVMPPAHSEAESGLHRAAISPSACGTV
jgi:two-component system chemotaxis sensor kinase CheA